MRKKAGELPSATEYRDRFGVDPLESSAQGSETAPTSWPPGPVERPYVAEAPRTDARWDSPEGPPKPCEEATACDSQAAFAALGRRTIPINDMPTEPAPAPTTPEKNSRIAVTPRTVAAALALLASLAAGMIVSQHRVERRAAHAALSRFEEQARDVEFLLGVPDAPMPMIDDGIARCRLALDAFGARTDPKWLARAPASWLPAADRARLRLRTGELLNLWARALAWQAETSSVRRAERIAESNRLLGLAEASYGAEREPLDLGFLRAGLARIAGHATEADRLTAAAETVAPTTAHGRLALVSERLNRGLDREALAAAEEAARLDPLEPAAWLLRGVCLARLAQYERADQSFSLGMGLRPGLGWAYLVRGKAALLRRNLGRALADSDRVLATEPDHPEALLLRARVELERGDPSGAIATLDRLLLRPDAPSVALFLRSHAHEVRGDKARAEADRREGLARAPGDEPSWLTRGQNRWRIDPAGALEDFRAARELNAKSLESFRNEAKLLSETLGLNEEALRALDQAIAHHPQSVTALSDRGLLLARLGRHKQARQDASAALALDDSAETLFQAACVFARAADGQPGAVTEPLRLLALAVRKDDAQLRRLGSDPDLASLRERPEFQRLRDALQIVCPTAVSPK